MSRVSNCRHIWVTPVDNIVVLHIPDFISEDKRTTTSSLYNSNGWLVEIEVCSECHEMKFFPVKPVIKKED